MFVFKIIAKSTVQGKCTDLKISCAVLFEAFLSCRYCFHEHALHTAFAYCQVQWVWRWPPTLPHNWSEKKRHDGNAISLIFQNAKVVSGFIYQIAHKASAVVSLQKVTWRFQVILFLAFQIAPARSVVHWVLLTDAESIHFTLIWRFGPLVLFQNSSATSH